MKGTHFLFVLFHVALAAVLQHDIPVTFAAEVGDILHDVFVL